MSYKSSHLGSVIDTSIQKIVDLLFLLKTGGTLTGILRANVNSGDTTYHGTSVETMGSTLFHKKEMANLTHIWDDANVWISTLMENELPVNEWARAIKSINAIKQTTGTDVLNNVLDGINIFNILHYDTVDQPYAQIMGFDIYGVNAGSKLIGFIYGNRVESRVAGSGNVSKAYNFFSNGCVKEGSATGKVLEFYAYYSDDVTTALNPGASFYHFYGKGDHPSFFGGSVGVGTTAPDKQLEINHATGQCLRLTYNDPNGSATYYADLTIDSAGNLVITPSGTQITCAVFPVTPSAAPTSNYQVANKKYVDDSSTAARPYQVCTLRFYTLVAGGDQGDPGDLTTLTFDVFENTIGTLEMEEPTSTNQIIFRFKDEAEEYISGLWWVNFPSADLTHNELYDAGYSLPDTDEIRLTHPYDTIHNQIYYIEIRLYPSKDTFTADAFRVGD